MSAPATCTIRPAVAGRFEALAALGFSVLPVRHPDHDGSPAGMRGKKPVDAWKAYQGRHATPEKRAAWEVAGHNVGVATGPISSCVVLDVDGPGADEELHRRGLVIPETARVRTGRWWHHYFRIPDGVDLGNAARVSGIPGLDFRGAGGYVVGPGSVHESGRRYEWAIPPGRMIALPEWAVALLMAPGPRPNPPPPSPTARRLDGIDAYALAALRGEYDSVRVAETGTRNHTLNRAAFKLGQIVAAGRLSEREVEDAMFQAADECGLLFDDGAASVRATIRSGLQAGMQQPRAPEGPRFWKPRNACSAASLAPVPGVAG